MLPNVCGCGPQAIAQFWLKTESHAVQLRPLDMQEQLCRSTVGYTHVNVKL